LLWVLIWINILLFIAYVVDQRTIVTLFGLQPISFSAEPWTIITNIFVHGGFWHILTNMLTLYFLGTFLSRLVGWGKFALIYFGGGILGNLFFIALTLVGAIYGISFLGSPFSVAVGASGAVFAVGGALAAMRPRVKVYVFPIPAPVPLWTAIIGGFIILTVVPGIAWQAHLGGLVFGLIVGYIFKQRERFTF